MDADLIGGANVTRRLARLALRIWSALGLLPPVIEEPDHDSTCRDCDEELLIQSDTRTVVLSQKVARASESHVEPPKAWNTSFHIDKYREGATEPYETVEVLENIGLNAGVALMLDLLIGAGGTTYANANARICVGDGSTAAAKAQTDLQGSNKLRQAVDATYPTRSSQTLTFVATFGSSDANWHWQEWGIANSASGATMLNRKVADMGTKESGETWVATALIVAS